MHSYDILVNRQHLLTKEDIPGDLVLTHIPFAPQTEEYKQYMRREAAASVCGLFRRAKEEGIELYGVSAYRSYERQAAIYETSIKKKGREHTEAYIAPPGGSEHQTGLALDVSCEELDYDLLPEFASTKEGKWLTTTAPLYGFILRYPERKEDITGYSYEPWHIRYVTKSLAFYLVKTEMTLDEYKRISN